MSPVPLETWRRGSTKFRRLPNGPEADAPTPPITPTKPWYGHIDQRDRGAPHPGTGHDPFDEYLADAIGVTRPVGMFMHGYSGSSYPASFASSAVSGAPARGVGAMLNVKISDWAGIVNGDYDSAMVGLFNTWPVGTPGVVTLNHEPENDGPTPASVTNPTYVTWAQTNGAIWCAGIRHWIDLIAPIIRARGLDVKIGGCLMDFSWDTTRWQYWKWWEGITPANLGQVDFGIDAYVKHDLVNGNPVGHDLMPRINQLLAVMRSAGIGSFSLYETAVDRRQRNNGDVVIGTEASMTAWWDNYYQRLEEIPEIRMVCYFHLPTGPASGQAWMTGTTITKYAQICMQGNRVLA